MFLNAKTLTIKIDNTTMDYITFGKGNKPLVLIPGLNLRRLKGSAFPVAYMYRIFAKNYKVYIFDRKEDITDNYSVREIAKDTAHAMNLLNISNADILGISQGGMIAQYIAIDYPQLVHKLALGVTLSKENSTVRTNVQNWIKMSNSNNYEAIVTDMLNKMYSDNYIKKYSWLFPILSKISKPKDLNRFSILANACLTCNTYNQLDKIKCPVFVIGGKLDKIVTATASEEIADKLQCEIYMYDKLGHSAYEEADDFNKKVFDFFIS